MVQHIYTDASTHTHTSQTLKQRAKLTLTHLILQGAGTEVHESCGHALPTLFPRLLRHEGNAEAGTYFATLGFSHCQIHSAFWRVLKDNASVSSLFLLDNVFLGQSNADVMECISLPQSLQTLEIILKMDDVDNDVDVFLDDDCDLPIAPLWLWIFLIPLFPPSCHSLPQIYLLSKQ